MEYQVAAIKFDSLGKRYYFSTNGIPVKMHDQVIVETVRGIELGFVVSEMLELPEQELVLPLKPVLRQASEADIKQYEENKANEKYVLDRSKELVKIHQLDMKMLNCEYTLDRSKLTIYFTADGRIDFRDLVKDLANEFHLRIELRQVGARDGAKVLGGIGPCGLLTCCMTFLGEFEPVSIKMAKNQNLSLNPSNISGLCGKLLCCIHYEDENYKEYRKNMPKVDSYLLTSDGKARVVQVNFIMETVYVQFPDGHMDTYHIKECQFREKAIEELVENGDEGFKELED